MHPTHNKEMAFIYTGQWHRHYSSETVESIYAKLIGSIALIVTHAIQTLQSYYKL